MAERRTKKFTGEIHLPKPAAVPTDSATTPASVEPAAELFATVPERDQGRISSSITGVHPTRPADLGARYQIGEPLGAGATGQVWTAQDLALDRAVALKVLGTAGGPAIARFIREARITAGIDHPNVVTIHDLAFGANGAAFFTMRRIEGRSLGEAIRSKSAGGPAPEIAELNQQITILLKVGDALTRAHDLGIVHRDIKPDNIMLGRYGEVAVVDWGEARRLDEQTGNDKAPATAIGTPIYMSPEQARGEVADRRSDVWCLGATLWHTITRQPPWTHEDQDRFWVGKRRGELTPLPPGVESHLPRRLLAIARKAMHPDPEDRYQDVGAMATDLARFQAGQSVAAMHEGLAARTLRWLRLRARGVALASLILLALGGSLGLWWQERERQVSDWGLPLIEENFAADSWSERWLEPEPGLWKITDGQIVSTGESANHLVYRRRFSGAVAIEFEGEMRPNSTPGDLSVWWTETDMPMENASDWNKATQRRLMVQAGGFTNTLCGIFNKTSCLAMVRRRFTPGLRYHLRYEFDDHDVRLIVDGETVLEHHDLIALGSGFVSIYAYYPGKVFREVKLFEKRRPELVPATAIGDELMRQRLLSKAALSYGQVADSQVSTPIGAEARYKQAGALWAMGNAKAARRAWSQISPGPWADLARCDRLDEQFRLGQIPFATAGLVRLYRELPACRAHLRLLWGRWADLPILARRNGDIANDAALLEAKMAAFPDESTSDWRAMEISLDLFGPQETLRRFPYLQWKRLECLYYLGRYAEAVARPEDRIGFGILSLPMLGRYDEALALSTTTQRKAYLLVQAGRGDEARRRFPDEAMTALMLGDPAQALVLQKAGDDIFSVILIHLGRFDEAIASEQAKLNRDEVGKKNRPINLVQTLLAAGRPGEAEAEGSFDRVPPAAYALAHRLAGDRLGEKLWRQKLRDSLPDWDWSNSSAWVNRRILEPLLSVDDGDSTPLRRHLTELADGSPIPLGGQAWHLARFALGRGNEEEMDHLVAPSERQALLALGQALRAELTESGDSEARKAAWQAFYALPPHQRLLNSYIPEPSLDLFARWRSGHLKSTDLR